MATAVLQPAEISSKHRGALPVCLFLFACAVVIARRPDALLHAQFYGEDGTLWFADAYNLGWVHALFLPHGGYLQTFPRLGAALALPFPFAFAPLVLNVIAIAVQALPVNILLSPRSSAWGSLRFRAVLAALYLALPNNEEMSAGITESQWILALCAFLLIVATPPLSRAAKAFDLSIFMLCGLTGPFCIILLFFAGFLAWKRLLGKMPVVVLIATSIIQGAELITHPGTRSASPLGANPEWFLRLLSGQVYLGTLLGPNQLALADGRFFAIFLACAAVVCSALVAACFKEAPRIMRLFLLFSAIIFAFSLASPLGESVAGASLWKLLGAAAGCRYWFFPSLAFVWSLAWCLRSRFEGVRLIAGCLLLLMSIGLYHGWKYHAFPDFSFPKYAQALDAAPAGTIVTIPQNPQGWQMRLVKH